MEENIFQSFATKGTRVISMSKQWQKESNWATLAKTKKVDLRNYKKSAKSKKENPGIECTGAAKIEIRLIGNGKTNHKNEYCLIECIISNDCIVYNNSVLLLKGNHL